MASLVLLQVHEMLRTALQVAGPIEHGRRVAAGAAEVAVVAPPYCSPYAGLGYLGSRTVTGSDDPIRVVGHTRREGPWQSGRYCTKAVGNSADSRSGASLASD